MQKNNTAVQAGKLNKLADWPIRTLILSCLLYTSQSPRDP